MGYFSLKRKNTPRTNQTPPPPYQDDNQPSDNQPSLIVTETTTRTEVVTTTTQTTTHFLSLPAWRQRSKNNGTHLRRPSTAGSIEVTEEHAPFRQRNKELPPTPSGLPLLLSRPSAMTSNRHQDPSQLTSSLSQSLHGFGYAQLALPQTSGSSTLHESEVNTVVFVPASSQSQPVSEPSLNIKRPEDSHGLGVSSYLTSPKEIERRTRGISLFGFTSTFDDKVDPKTKEQAWEPASEQLKPLTRKLSFWSRKKARSQPRPFTAHGDFSHFHDSCEINLSDSTPSSHSAQKLQPRNPLSHSFSERPQSYYPVASPDISISPPPSSPTRRPTTADNPGPIRITAPSFSRTSGQTCLPRPRSQTNPPLLRRLSLNVFSSQPLLTTSPTSSPSSLLSASSNPYRSSVIIPHPLEEESPGIYLDRLMDTVSKAEITKILASRYSSAQVFHVCVLNDFLGLSHFTPQHWKSSLVASSL